MTATGPLELLAIDHLLTEEERDIQASVREFVDRRVRPTIADAYERGEADLSLMPEAGALGLLGMHLEAIGCFGLTEPDFGSNPGGMRTRAKPDGDDWVLNGTKLWITNGSVADVAVVWGPTDDGVRGFLVPTGTEGFTTRDVKHKLSLRASVTSELVLDDVRLPGSALLPEATSLRGPLSCLNEARYGIVWGAAGAARACLEAALGYAKERIVFGKPIAAT